MCLSVALKNIQPDLDKVEVIKTVKVEKMFKTEVLGNQPTIKRYQKFNNNLFIFFSFWFKPLSLLEVNNEFCMLNLFYENYMHGYHLKKNSRIFILSKI